MKKFLIILMIMLFFVGLSNAQTKSMIGKVVSVERGMYKWAAIVVRVGSEEYFVYTESGTHPTPKIIGKVEEIGRTVRFFLYEN